MVVEYLIFDNHSLIVKCFWRSGVLGSYSGSIHASPVIMMVIY